MLVSQLRNALASAKVVTAAHGALPVLSCVLLEARNGGTRISGTDIRRYRTIQLPDAWQHPRTAVDAAMLLDRLRSLPEGELTICEQGAGIRVSSSTSKLSFVVPVNSEPDLFPAPITVESNLVVRIDGTTLASTIKRVMHAVSPDWTRPHLNSVQLELEPGALRAVATDGHRMAVAQAAAEHTITASVLVPMHGAALMVACSDAEIKLEWGSESLTMTDGEVSTTIKLSDAVFPPWRAVAGRLFDPTQTQATHTIPRAEWLASAKALAGVRDKDSAGLELRFEQDLLSMRAESSDAGFGSDAVTCSTHKGKKLTIGLDSRYLIDAISAVDADNVDVVAGGDLAPFILRGKTASALVMQRRV